MEKIINITIILIMFVVLMNTEIFMSKSIAIDNFSSYVKKIERESIIMEKELQRKATIDNVKGIIQIVNTFISLITFLYVMFYNIIYKTNSKLSKKEKQNYRFIIFFLAYILFIMSIITNIHTDY